MSRDHLNQINQPTTSLFIESGHKYSLNPFLEDIATQFTLQWTNFCLQGFSCVFEAYIKRFYLKKGDLVTFSDHQRQYTGCFEKLFPDGSIQLLLKNGELKQFFSGYSL